MMRKTRARHVAFCTSDAGVTKNRKVPFFHAILLGVCFCGPFMHQLSEVGTPRGD